ncbi:MAG: phospho-sugar mutase [Clostridia bacterium]|nr:phospho-sugar mutase [Clostridia bacterium]
MGYMENYNRWLTSDKTDEATKAELIAIKDNDEEIKLRFYQSLQFGTAGLRGTMNAGTNAMNVYTVTQATQAIATLIKEEGKAAMERGVAIACDSRNNSELFSKCAAEVLAANGIKVFIFESLRPTPVLSFAIRHLNCIAGINITASHNPKEYNGYKAYWEDGAQLPPEHAQKVSDIIAVTDIFDGVSSIPFEDGIKSGLIKIIGEEVDAAYLENVYAQAIDTEMIKEMADDIKIVYTPLHGAGYKLVPRVIDMLGFKNLYMVKEQSEPDGNFPTTPFPNPEFKDVFNPGIKLAKEIGSDLIIATDPDADRVGIAVRVGDDFVTMTGNQVGAILLEYIITALKNTGKMPNGAYAVKSFVSTELVSKIAAVNGVKLYNVFTGFKYIGEVIKREEKPGEAEFLLGFEESYGYLRGTYARDKDAVVGTMLICEVAAYYKKRGMTLYDAMQEIYNKYGFYRDGVDNITMKGLDGIDRMKRIMKKLREEPPKELAGVAVDTVIDYNIPCEYNLKTGEKTMLDTGTTNTVYFKCGDDVVVIRPSGTEPKIKLYYLVSEKTAEGADAKVAKFKEAGLAIIDSIK